MGIVLGFEIRVSVYAVPALRIFNDADALAAHHSPNVDPA